MADTTILKYKVESWIRDTWLPEQPEFSGIKFTSCHLPLATGGEFEFDAVDKAWRIAICISTSSAKTAGGKANTGATHKIRADMLFLLLANVEQRIVVFTDRMLFLRFEDDRINRKRVPENIRFMHAPLPPALQEIVERVRRSSSKEQGGAR